MEKIPTTFGELVFDDRVMKARLPGKVYFAMKKTIELEVICKHIRDKLVCGIEKRLIADAKVGFLLSGGLDSSLVCAIAQKNFKR